MINLLASDNGIGGITIEDAIIILLLIVAIAIIVDIFKRIINK